MNKLKGSFRIFFLDCRKIASILLSLILLLAICSNQFSAHAKTGPGSYASMGKDKYTEWVRTSEYVAMRDGTKLAVDIYRPSVKGKVADKKLPLVWTQTVYHRADIVNGQTSTLIDSMNSLQLLLNQGYIIAVADARGTGASFGIWKGLFMPEEAKDAYDLTEWFATRPWCDGNIGMFGGSYLGMTQYNAAGELPPHLKAIVPAVSYFDVYDALYPGGIFRNDLVYSWSSLVNKLNKESPGAPVDADPYLTVLRKAMHEHNDNLSLSSVGPKMKNRDSFKNTAIDYYNYFSPYTRLDNINKSRVPIYHIGGWFDAFTKDTFLFLNNVRNRQKALIGPWPHLLMGTEYADLIAMEHLKWYDYWLKGIQNGVMDEPSIIYYRMSSTPRKGEWKSTSVWPLADEKLTKYYFEIEKANSRAGSLSKGSWSKNNGKLSYTADYTTTSGKSSRFANAYGGGFKYPEMNSNDNKGCYFDTPVLSHDVEVTGHLVIDLYMSSTIKDADVFVYLEDVNEKGVSTYITEGALRASHRALGRAPFNNMNLPYHPSLTKDIKPLTTAPAELKIDLQPTSYLFEKGHKIRITITSADKDNANTPPVYPRPVITIYTDKEHPSNITLPIIQ